MLSILVYHGKYYEFIRSSELSTLILGSVFDDYVAFYGYFVISLLLAN